MINITFIQIRRALALATNHGHQWASSLADDLTEKAYEAARYEDRAIVPTDVLSAMEKDAVENCGPCGGICAPHAFETYGRTVISHTTGSGRLSWEIEESGAVNFIVSRAVGPVFADALKAAKDETQRNALIDALRNGRGSSVELVRLTLCSEYDKLCVAQDLVDGVPVTWHSGHVDALVGAVLAINFGCIADAIIDVASAKYSEDSSTISLRDAILANLRQRQTDYINTKELDALLEGLPRTGTKYVKTAGGYEGQMTVSLLEDREYPGYESTDDEGNVTPPVPHTVPIQLDAARLSLTQAIEISKNAHNVEDMFAACAFWAAYGSAWDARNASAEQLAPLAETMVRRAKALDPHTYLGPGINAQTVGYAATFSGGANPAEVVFGVHSALAPDNDK